MGLVLIIGINASPIIALADNGNTIVHITATGKCYHTEGCYHLRSDYEITLYEAVVEHGYNPCEDCNPPIYDGPEPLHDKMEKSKGGSSKNQSSKINKQTSKSANVQKSTNSEKKEDPVAIAVVWVIIGVIVCGTVVSIVSAVRDTYKKSKELAQKKKWEKEQFEKERQKYYEMYANEDPLNFVEVPKGSFIKDGYPCTDDADKGLYGEYTAYVASKRPRVMHLKQNCGSANLVPVNYVLACNLQHCKRCAVKRNANLPKIAWYVKYQEITNIKKKYGIP